MPSPTIAERLGPAAWENRQRRATGKGVGEAHVHWLWDHFHRRVPAFTLFRWFLKATFLWERGKHNFLDLQLVENTLPVPRLPAAFEGFRILHLSDLHIDLEPALIPAIRQLIDPLEYDLAVITGDYRESASQDWQASVDLTAQLLPGIRPPVYGVLGNHDDLAMVEPLEQAGLKLLLNEHVPLQRGGDTLYLAGVDDSTYFNAHDLARARAGLAEEACVLLLAHGPEIHQEAAEMGYSLMLSGHTHGGQVCLPNAFAFIRHGGLNPPYLAGPWVSGNMPGYTSRGTGGCRLPVRFNCPGEVTLHTLVRGG